MTAVLVRSSEAHSDFFGELFVKHLPANFRRIPASTADLVIVKVVELANKTAEHAISTDSSVTSSVPPSISTLGNRILQITDAINALLMLQQGRQPTPCRHTRIHAPLHKHGDVTALLRQIPGANRTTTAADITA